MENVREEQNRFRYNKYYLKIQPGLPESNLITANKLRIRKSQPKERSTKLEPLVRNEKRSLPTAWIGFGLAASALIFEVLIIREKNQTTELTIISQKVK